MLGPDDDHDKVLVTVTITCSSQEQVLKASETLQRTAVGLALEGMSTSLTTYHMVPLDAE